MTARRQSLRHIDSYTPAPAALVRLRILRDGQVTANKKLVRLFTNWKELNDPALAFETRDGEHSNYVRVDLAALLSNEWFALGYDDSPPRRVRGSILSIGGSGTYTLNITSGEGGGGPQGDPAAASALVRVDGAPASREVVLLERPSDGQWRVAGVGVSAEAGQAEIDARVIEGQVYALCPDDWGVSFQSSLSVEVGQRIRPSLFAGVLYEITEAGTLPAAEPAWWPITTEGSRELGTARAVAVRYYRPLAHGPVTVEVL